MSRINRVCDLKKFLDPLRGHIRIKPPLDLRFEDGVVYAGKYTVDIVSDGFTGNKIEAGAVEEYKEGKDKDADEEIETVETIDGEYKA